MGFSLPQAIRSSKQWMVTKVSQLKWYKTTAKREQPRMMLATEATAMPQPQRQPSRRRRSTAIEYDAPRDDAPRGSLVFGASRSKRRVTAAEEREAARSPLASVEGEWKPCKVCQTTFQFITSKYLDFCSEDCKATSLAQSGEPDRMSIRLSEWL